MYHPKNITELRQFKECINGIPMQATTEGVAFALDKIASAYPLWDSGMYIMQLPEKINNGAWLSLQRRRHQPYFHLDGINTKAKP